MNICVKGCASARLLIIILTINLFFNINFFNCVFATDEQQHIKPPIVQRIPLHAWDDGYNFEINLWSESDWRIFGRQIEARLQSLSLEDVAALKPYAERAFELLKTTPGGKPYAAWLAQRLDYIEVAHQAKKLTLKPKMPTVEHWKKALNNTRPNDEKRIKNDIISTIKIVFHEEGVPTELVWLAEVESSLNPQARNPVGAVGLFQIMPDTAIRYGLRVNAYNDDRLNPEKSARVAAKYLKFLYNKFLSWPLVFAAYNAGEGRVGRLLQKNNAKTFEEISDYLPVETQMYVPKVMATVALREGKDPRCLPSPKDKNKLT